MRRRPFFLTFLVPSILIAVIFLAALGNVLQYSFRAFIPGSLDVGGFTLENFSRLAKPIYFWVLVDTFVISLATAVFTLLLSYPVAYALVRTRSNGLLNTMLRSWGLITRPIPLMYTELGVIIALVQFSMPVMIILLATAISHIDRDYEKAAANLGAAPAKVFWTVTLPLSMPGIVSGTVVIFAWTMSAFSTPQLIGGGKVLMISNLVYLQGLSSFNFPFAAVLSLIALLAAIGSIAAMRPFTLRLERKAALH